MGYTPGFMCNCTGPKDGEVLCPCMLYESMVYRSSPGSLIQVDNITSFGGTLTKTSREEYLESLLNDIEDIVRKARV